MATRKRIVYIQYTNPAAYPPLEHSSQILAERGWEVLFLGVGAWREANTFRFTSFPQITVRLLPFVEAGWQQKIHYLGYWLWVIWNVLVWRPHWVYASDTLVTPLAWLLTFFPATKVLYHEHDAPSAPNSGFLRWVLGMRTQLAQRATAIVIPNAERSDLFRQETGTSRPIYIVWNCPRRDEVGPKRESALQAPLRVLFQGSIVPDRLPSTLIDALAVLPEIELHVVGYETIGSRGYVDTLRAKAKTLGADARFIVHGALPTRTDVRAVIQQCDIGLALMPTASTDDINLRTMSGASNKPFDYLANGVSLIVSTLPDWCEMFVEPGYAKACLPENVASLVETLRWYQEYPDMVRLTGEAGRQKVLDTWNYEAQFTPLLSYFS